MGICNQVVLLTVTGIVTCMQLFFNCTHITCDLSANHIAGTTHTTHTDSHCIPYKACLIAFIL